MSNRWLRFGIALLAIGAASAAGYRIYQQQQLLTNGVVAARAIDGTAEDALATMSEIKAALHAYVAEGQGYAFWTARTASLIEKLRASLLQLDPAATVAGVPLTEALNLADRLGAAEQRARDHVRAGQRLLAGEVIFTEARDVLDAMRTQVAAARTRIAEADAQAAAATRRTQTIVALSTAGGLSLVMLLLTLPAASVASPVGPATVKTTVAEPSDEFGSSARVVARTPVKPASPSPPPTTAPAARPAATGTTSTARVEPTAKPAAPPAAPAPSPVPASLREAAAICTELGRASQSIEVSNLLARASKVLDATGAIVWMATPDGRELYPAASAGYDERLLERIGSIPRTANNVTASAIRTGTARTSARVGQSAAALAIPLLTPLGAVGVLSAELKNVQEVDETRLAVATIFAAQLAGVVGARATASASASAANAKANAAP